MTRLPAGPLGERLEHIATSAADRQLGTELQEARLHALAEARAAPVIRIRLPAKRSFRNLALSRRLAGFVLRDLGRARKLTPRRLLALDIRA
jgi:hypothetical protein